MPISTCAVTGNVKNLLNSNVQNCTVKASVLTPFFHGTAWISGEISSTTTDSSGNFSLSVIETETVGKKISFTFEYNDGTGATKRRAYTVVVPDEASATLADLVTSDVAAIVANTFPASSVTVNASGNLSSTDAQSALVELQTDVDTRALASDLTAHLADTSDAHDASAISVSPTGNLAADDVQEALAELQTDIDTRATSAALTAHIDDTTDAHDASAISVSPSGNLAADDVQEALTELQGDIDAINTLANGKIYIGNGSNAATEVTPAGDVTIANDGTTAIASGVIVNADVNASAAIAYSKLNLANSIVNADVGAAAAIAYSKLNLGTSIVNADVNASAAIAYSKLNLATSIVNADVAAAAAIARTKIASGTNYRILANSSSGVMSENAALTAKHVIIADANGQLSGIAPGTANNVLKSDGTDWTSGTVAAPNLAVSSKTTTYTATSSDDFLILSGASFTVTLPAAASNTGKVLAFKHNDSTLGRVYTIDGNSSETIDGAATRKISTQHEVLRIISDGTNWQILERKIPSVETTYTPTFTGFGTASSIAFTWRRVGDRIQIRGRWTSGTSTGTEARVTVPSGITTDSAKIVNIQLVGTMGYSPAFDRTTYVMSEPSIDYVTFSAQGSGVFNKVTGSSLCSSGEILALFAEVPITDWEG